MQDINEIALKQIEKIHNDCMGKDVLVVIRCITYNHEPYIRKALDGFVMQKTNFPFVAIVHDDASKDKTATIIKEYAERYPNVIKPLYEKENQYSKKDGSLTQIMSKACVATGAKYIAICEGDDYWTDSLKLQKQVDFLESHSEYGLVHTNVSEATWKDGFSQKKKFNKRIPDGNVYYHILKKNFITTLTVMFRASLLEYLNSEAPSNCIHDRIMWICFSRHTKFHYIEDVTGTYNILSQSMSNGTYSRMMQFYLNTTDQIIHFLETNDIPQKDIYIFLKERNKLLLKYSYLSRDKNTLKKIWRYIYKIGKPTIEEYIIYFLGVIKFPISLIEILKKIKETLRQIY